MPAQLLVESWLVEALPHGSRQATQLRRPFLQGRQIERNPAWPRFFDEDASKCKRRPGANYPKGSLGSVSTIMKRDAHAADSIKPTRWMRSSGPFEQSVEGALDDCWLQRGDVRVETRGFELGVSQKTLDEAHIDAVLEQVGGERVAYRKL